MYTFQYNSNTLSHVQPVVASTIFMRMSIKAEDASRLKKLITKDGQVTGTNLNSLEFVVQEGILIMLLIMNNVSNILHDCLVRTSEHF